MMIDADARIERANETIKRILDCALELLQITDEIARTTVADLNELKQIVARLESEGSSV